MVRFIRQYRQVTYNQWLDYNIIGRRGRIGFVWTGIVSRDLNNLFWAGTFNFNRHLMISVITAGDKLHSSATKRQNSRLDAIVKSGLENNGCVAFLMYPLVHDAVNTIYWFIGLMNKNIARWGYSRLSESFTSSAHRVNKPGHILC